MKLYSLTDTGAVVDPEDGAQYDVAEDGSFELPDALGAFLHNSHQDGKAAWETDGERSLRLAAEEEERRRDPATLLAEIEAIRRQLSGASTAADIRAAAEKAAKDAEELAKQAEAAEEAEALAAEQAEKQAAADAEQAKEHKKATKAEAKAAEPGLEVSDSLTPPAEPGADEPAAEIPDGAPAADEPVDKINNYLTELKGGDNAELYASERNRLIEGQERKGLIEGPHAEAPDTGGDLL